MVDYWSYMGSLYFSVSADCKITVLIKMVTKAKNKLLVNFINFVGYFFFVFCEIVCNSISSGCKNRTFVEKGVLLDRSKACWHFKLNFSVLLNPKRFPVFILSEVFMHEKHQIHWYSMMWMMNSLSDCCWPGRHFQELDLYWCCHRWCRLRFWPWSGHIPSFS